MYDDLPGESVEIRNRKNNNMVKNRLLLVGCFFIFGFLAVTFKAADVMLLHGGQKKVISQHYGKRERAEIIDRNGVIIATNLHTESVYANPKEMIELEESVKKLSKALNVDEATTLKDIKNGKDFVWVKRNVTPQEQMAVNELGLPGINYAEDIARVYPQGPLLSHVLGYVNVDNQGLAGLEREFDDLLSWGAQEPLQVSLDVNLQQIMHEELVAAIKNYHGLGGSAMMVDVTNGEVLVLISYPDFDPNSANTATKDEKFNRVTLGTYELGSVFKGFTASTGLDLGKVTPNTMFDATHNLQIGKATIHDYHAKKRMLSLTEVLEYSSNVGTARLGLLIGTENLRDYLQKFGMFDMATLEIPEKGHPQVPKHWSDIVTATVSFGHGLAVSIVHLLHGYQAIVNGGFLHPLTLIKKKPGDVIESTQILKTHTSEQMRELLRDIVLNGTGKNADVPGYMVGGKTGTAEKSEHGRYIGEKVMSSFIAAFPINNPKYLVYALVDEPQEIKPGVRPTAGIVAAPIIKNFISRAAPLLGMKPEADPKNETNKNAPLEITH